MPSMSRRQAIASLGSLVALPDAVAAAQTRPATPSGIEGAKAAESAVAAVAAPAVQQRLVLREQHLRLTHVVLQDRTDVHNELAQTRDWLLHPSETLELQGNLFVLEDTVSGRGRVLLKLAPLPHARPVRTNADLLVAPRKDTGFDITLFGGDGAGEFVVIDYEGGVMGRTRALQQFQRGRMPGGPAHRTPRFLSNTWGDRSRDGRISRAFIEAEIDAAARLGVEVVQIDDGWQKGITSNSARAAGKGRRGKGSGAHSPTSGSPIR